MVIAFWSKLVSLINTHYQSEYECGLADTLVEMRIIELSLDSSYQTRML